MMRTRGKGILFRLLPCFLLFAAFFIKGPDAYAGPNTGKALQLADYGITPNIRGAQQDCIYFGSYPQTLYNDNWRYDPIRWRVLENAEEELFLFSDKILDAREYNSSDEPVTWETSYVRKWLNGTIEPGKYGNNFYYKAFSETEQEEIMESTLDNPPNPFSNISGGNETTDKVFLLSMSEAHTPQYGFRSGAVEYSSSNADQLNLDPARQLVNTAYTARGGGMNAVAMSGEGEPDRWWTRTPGSQRDLAVFIAPAGWAYTTGYYATLKNFGIAPAIKLNKYHFIFTSDAVGGKVSGEPGADAMKPVSEHAGNDWKVTLWESRRSEFAASCIGQHDGIAEIAYSGAVPGEREYISALVMDGSGAVTWYGRIAPVTSGSGTVSVKVRGKMHSGDRLFVFNEQYNGDGWTDVSSTVIEVTPTDVFHRVTFETFGHGTTPPAQEVEAGQTVSKPSDPFVYGLRFDGWYAGTDFALPYDFGAPVTEDLVLYAKWTEFFTVSFDTQGHGTEPESVTAWSGETVYLPTLSEDSMSFGGWYLEPECLTRFESGVTPVTGNITLYAKWGGSTAIAYDINGGIPGVIWISYYELPAGTVISGTVGEPAREIALPPAGHVFDGLEIGDKKYGVGESYSVTIDEYTVVTYLWKPEGGSGSRTGNPSEDPDPGWNEIDGKWYYYKNQSFAKGWEKIDGFWYYFDDDGVMKSDEWFTDHDGSTYYFEVNGAMHTGWLAGDKGWCCFDDSGKMVKNNWWDSCYYGPDGIMYEGKTTPDGFWTENVSGYWNHTWDNWIDGSYAWTGESGARSGEPAVTWGFVKRLSSGELEISWMYTDPETGGSLDAGPLLYRVSYSADGSEPPFYENTNTWQWDADRVSFEEDGRLILYTSNGSVYYYHKVN